MKFTIEVEDFYLDEDSGSIDVELKKHITTSVVSQIEKNIEKKIDEEIMRCVKQHVENILLKKISAKVAELIELGEITVDRQKISELGEITVDKQKISIADFVRSQFEKNVGWRCPYEQIVNIAKKFGEELKMRYDKAFAVHIVDTMKKNGLLKDEAIAKLLPVE